MIFHAIARNITPALSGTIAGINPCIPYLYNAMQKKNIKQPKASDRMLLLPVERNMTIFFIGSSSRTLKTCGINKIIIKDIIKMSVWVVFSCNSLKKIPKFVWISPDHSNGAKKFTFM